MRSDTSLNITAREILVYLNEHPGAQDTLDGITNWWLPQGRSRKRVDVENALAELIRQGMVIEVKVKGSPSVYRLARRKKGS